MNICAICGIASPNYMAYHMHVELMHKVTPNTQERHATPAKLTPDQKARIVARCEARLGVQHFFGK